MVGIYPVQIASGQALSGMVDVCLERWAGVVMPAAWTAADVTFQVSYDGGTTWVDMWTDAGEFKLPSAQVAANRMFALDVHQTAGVCKLRIRSGVSGAPVNQAALRTLQVVTRTSGEV